MKQDTVRDDGVQYNTFDWGRWEGTAMARIARYVLAWAEEALQEEHFNRGDYRYSLELIVVLLGRDVNGFIIRRVFKVGHQKVHIFPTVILLVPHRTVISIFAYLHFNIL